MKPRLNITLNDILSQVEEEQILNYYFGYSIIKGNIKSPLRDEKGASFNIKKYNNSITCKDFGGDEFSGNLYSLLSKYFNISYIGVLDMLYRDIEKIKKSPKTIIDNTIKYIASKNSSSKKLKIDNSNLSVITREWRDYDLEFWETFGISKLFLNGSNTYPITHILIQEDNIIKKIPTEKYAYAYAEFKDGKTTFKIYQPFSIEHKWINKHDPSVWDLWNKLPKTGKYLIITSSRKDALCIWENTGIPSTSLQSESYKPKSQVIEELKNRFEHIFVLFDNDFDKPKNVGLINATLLCEQYKLNLLLIPEKYQTKDPSDYCKKFGRKKLKQLINTLILQLWQKLKNQ